MPIITRRDFLRMFSFGSLGLVTGCASLPATPTPVAEHGMDPTVTPVMANLSVPTVTPPAVKLPVDLEIALKATRAEVPILKGPTTRVFTYQGQVLQGDPASLQTLPNSYLGPIIRAHKGQTVRVNFTNDLPETSIIHWHGLHVPPDMDGHPRLAIGPGQSYVYEFRVTDRAGTYWFHAHPHGRTGPQVYQGLAGLFLVTDDEETAAGLPAGEYDVPLIIQDRTFDPDNQLVYLPGGMMDQMMGLLGDQILVNGQPDFALPVATRAYRLRLLNGSNSRIYKLAWSDKTPLTVIATDGGLLEAPVERDYITLGPGERIELWADFTGRPPGAEVKLQSLAFIGAEGDELAPSGGMQGHMGHGEMMMSAASLPNGQPFDVLTVRVERDEKETLTKPTKLAALTRYNLEDAINAANPRSYSLTFRQMVWLLNERQFEMDGTADNEIVRLNDLEVWEFVNELNPGQMMETLGMAHPMHIHGVQFQVLSREVLPEVAAGVESVREGYVDEGWKDTILLMPGERVKLLLKFSDYPGLYLYHCHNLEHEDQGMMRNYRVET